MTGGAGAAGQDAIRRVLPHRFPMLLVDRVVELVPHERVVAVKAVTCNEPWYQAIAEDAPAEAFAYPPVLVVESWCQAASMLAGWTAAEAARDGSVALFGGISDLWFRGQVWPGDVLEHRVRLAREFGDTWVFEGEAVAGGQTVLEVGRVMTALRPAAVLRPGAAVPAGTSQEGM